MSISARNLVWEAKGRRIINGVDLTIRPGRILGLLGPNGSGKSSLLRLLAGLRQPKSGAVLLGDRDIHSISRRTVAKRIALVEQHASTDANVSVQSVVRLGRLPHSTALSAWTHQDENAVASALERVGLADRRSQNWQTLSGGERQRVHIARALAQQPTEILLDEPTNHLDIQHQIELMRLIGTLAKTTIMALHDLNHAAAFCDDIVVLAHGQIVAAGAPVDVLTEELLREVFKVEARLETSPYHGKPHIHFMIG
jgi:iron complex transport system ATP-binding protein